MCNGLETKIVSRVKTTLIIYIIITITISTKFMFCLPIQTGVEQGTFN